MDALSILIFLLFFGGMIYLLYKSIVMSNNRKEKIEQQKEEFNAIERAELKHTSGLPFPEGVTVEVLYGSDKITFVKNDQTATINNEQIRSIDVITGKDLKSNIATGAIAGKFVLGGLAGAAIGALLSTSTYLVIGYESNNENKAVILDTAMSGMFSTKLQKFFKSNYNSNDNDKKNIEL